MNSSTAKSFTSAAIFASIGPGSNLVISVTPERPARSPCQVFSTPVPSAVMSPVPVMTTRRSDTLHSCSTQRLPSGLLVGVDVIDGIPDGLDVLRLLVRDLD